MLTWDDSCVNFLLWQPLLCTLLCRSDWVFYIHRVMGDCNAWVLEAQRKIDGYEVGHDWFREEWSHSTRWVQGTYCLTDWVLVSGNSVRCQLIYFECLEFRGGLTKSLVNGKEVLFFSDRLRKPLIYQSMIIIGCMICLVIGVVRLKSVLFFKRLF